MVNSQKNTNLEAGQFEIKRLFSEKSKFLGLWSYTAARLFTSPSTNPVRLYIGQRKKLGRLTISEKYFLKDLRNALLQSEKYSLKKQRNILFIQKFKSVGLLVSSHPPVLIWSDFNCGEDKKLATLRNTSKKCTFRI